MSKKNKNTAIHFNNKGNVCYKLRQHKEAIVLYTKAIDLCPDISHFYGNRGQAYYQLKLYEESIADSQKAIQLDASFWKGYIRAGKSHVRMGQLEKAEQCYKTAIQTHPDSTEVLNVANFELEKLAELMTQMQAAREHYNSEHYGSCIQTLESLMVTVSHCAELHLMLCDAYCYLRQYQQVPKIVEKTKACFNLTEAERQRLVVAEMKAFGALTANRWGVHERIQARLKEGRGSNADSLYDVLGASRDASQADIAEAYTDLALRHHPERQSDTISEEELEAVTCKYLDATEAFIVLVDPELRELYDLGVPVSDILSEDIDPYVLLCGFRPQTAEPDGYQKCMQSCIGWTCTPVISAATGISSISQIVKQKMCGGKEGLTWEQAWEEQKMWWLQQQKKHMLVSVREQAQQQGTAQ